jgi:outer membrane lipoprotein-sorting protein
MRCPVSLTAVLIAVTLAAPSFAAPQGSVDEIVAKTLKAKGGVEALRGTNTVRMRGKLNPPGVPQDVMVEMLAKRPNLVRREMKMGEMTVLSGYDGSNVWVKKGEDAAQNLTGPQADQVKQQLEFDSVFLDYKAQGHTIALVGQETLNGKPVHHVKVTRKDGQVQEYYLDAATGLETRMAMDVEQSGIKLKAETEFSDYREVAGRMVPFKMKNFTNGTPAGEITFEQIEFNVPIDDAQFRAPAAK